MMLPFVTYFWIIYNYFVCLSISFSLLIFLIFQFGLSSILFIFFTSSICCPWVYIQTTLSTTPSMNVIILTISCWSSSSYHPIHVRFTRCQVNLLMCMFGGFTIMLSLLIIEKQGVIVEIRQKVSHLSKAKKMS